MSEQRMPSIIDFAHEIIAIDKEARFLREDRDHYKAMYKQEVVASNRSHQATIDNISFMVGEIVNPDSDINQMHGALARERMEPS